MAALPKGIVGSAGPANHAAGKEKTEKRDDDHAKGFAANVGNGIESDLSAESGSRVAAAFGGQGVSSFMASSREEENDIGDEGDDQSLWVELIHKGVRLEF